MGTDHPFTAWAGCRFDLVFANAGLEMGRTWGAPGRPLRRFVAVFMDLRSRDGYASRADASSYREDPAVRDPRVAHDPATAGIHASLGFACDVVGGSLLGRLVLLRAIQIFPACCSGVHSGSRLAGSVTILASHEILLLGFVALGLSASARVVRIEILSRTPVLDGQSFGTAGPYEEITARVTFAV